MDFTKSICIFGRFDNAVYNDINWSLTLLCLSIFEEYRVNIIINGIVTAIIIILFIVFIIKI